MFQCIVSDFTQDRWSKDKNNSNGCKKKVYRFEIQFYYVLTPKTFKLVDISRKSKKKAKNSYGGFPTEFVPEVQKSIGSIGDRIIHGEVFKLNGMGRSGEPNFSGQTAE
jgi:hypothetical protein